MQGFFIINQYCSYYNKIVNNEFNFNTSLHFDNVLMSLNMGLKVIKVKKKKKRVHFVCLLS